MKHPKPNAVAADTVQSYFLHDGDGFITVNNFDPLHGQLWFDSGTLVNDGILAPLGSLYDGETFSNSHGTATFEVHAVDGGTLIEMGDDGYFIAGLSPSDLHGYNIFGG